jgi:hypothetical protein
VRLASCRRGSLSDRREFRSTPAALAVGVHCRPREGIVRSRWRMLELAFGRCSTTGNPEPGWRTSHHASPFLPRSRTRSGVTHWWMPHCIANGLRTWDRVTHCPARQPVASLRNPHLSTGRASQCGDVRRTRSRDRSAARFL